MYVKESFLAVIRSIDKIRKTMSRANSDYYTQSVQMCPTTYSGPSQHFGSLATDSQGTSNSIRPIRIFGRDGLSVASVNGLRPPPTVYTRHM